MKSYVYLHGFASSPASSKAQYFKARLAEHDIALEIPDLEGGDFEHLTITGQLEIVEKHLHGRACVLFGSSMGGYLAAIYAQRHPEVDQLVLMAPAFDLRTRWMEAMAAPALADWQATGKLPVFHYGEKRQRDLSYGLMEDARGYPAYPDFSQPALIFHGRRDNVVPVEFSRNFAASHGNVQFHELHSGHELTNVLPKMWELTQLFLAHE